MNIDHILQAIFIGLVVATFLLNTGRAQKAIEVCRECLIFLNHDVLKKETDIFNLLHIINIYKTIFRAYCLIPDHTKALIYGRKLLDIYRKCGKKDEEANLSVVLAEMYRQQYKELEARELYERANNIAKEMGNRLKDAYTDEAIGIISYHLCEFSKANKYLKKALAIRIKIGDKKGEAADYANLGAVFQALGEYDKAKEYLEKALAIAKEIGYQSGEAGSYGNLGNVFMSLGEYHKAKEYLEKAIAIKKEIGDQSGEASSYGNLGTVYKSLGEYDKAKEYLEKALVIKKEIGDQRGEATSYGNLGTVFMSLGEYHKAKEYLEKAIAIRIQIGDKKGEAADYGNLGTVFQSVGEYDKAKEYLEKALVIDKEIGHQSGEATSYGNLGNVFMSLGEYHKAKEYLKKALAITKEIGDQSGEAGSYANLGTVFKSLGEYDKAKEYLEKALVIEKKIGDQRGEATSYGSLGTMYISLGEYDKAKEYLEKALAIAKEIGNKGGEATAYVNLGTVFQSVGEYDKAKEHLEKALVIKKEIGDQSGEATSYGNLGTVFISLGEYDKAKEYLEKALAIQIQIGDKEGEAAGYGSLGTVFISLGEYDKAKEYFEKALAIRIQIGDKEGEARDCGNLGTVFHSVGEYEKAKEYLEKALVISKEIGLKSGEANSYGNLGTMFMYRGEYDKTKEYHEKALAIRKEIGDKSGEASSCEILGGLCLLAGEHFMAEFYLEKGLSITRDIEDLRSELNILCGLTVLKLSQYKVQEAFGCLILSMNKSESLRRFLRDNDDFKVSSSDGRDFPYRGLSLFFCLIGNPNYALHVLELSRARALTDLMASQYSVESPLSADPQSWIGVENIMKRESNSSCLYISYYVCDVLFWVLKTSGIIHFRRITVDEELVAAGLVGKLDDFFAKSFRSFGILAKEDCEDRSLNEAESSAALRLIEEEDEERGNSESSFSLCYSVLISPVADLLEEPELIIVPGRSLNQVPFAALTDKGGRCLSDKFRIRIVPSLTTLKLIQDSPAHYHSQSGALIVGDPDVGTVRYKGREMPLSRLPCAAKEAVMIGRLLGVQPLLGKHATKQAVLDRLHSVSLIHFAAHGNAERGEIALSPLGPPGRVSEEEDYLLTMSDIARVQLRAKLVVLSCCHSARGKIRAEGVIGIARAFLGSGARSVLVALWAISDKATEQLMCRFYEHLARGESASESLHLAMKWMRGHGFDTVWDWAPFMLIGDNVTFDIGKYK